MEEVDKVSIIVPVYNVQCYLKRCLESLRLQTYNNIEVLLVDDGSTDESGKICDEYSEFDDRFITIHKTNGGLSDARNKGIENCTGSYLSFVDADDWLSLNAIDVLVASQKMSQADIVVANLKRINRFESYCETAFECKRRAYSREEAVESYLYQRISPSACAKLYKHELFEGVKYPKGKLFEDVVTTYRVINKTKSVFVISEVVYFYFVRDGSIVTEKFNTRKMDYLLQTTELYELVKRDHPHLSDAAISRKIWAEIHLIVKMGDDRIKYREENEQLWKDIKKNRLRILKNKKVRRINRLVLLLSYGGQCLLCAVYSRCGGKL